LNPTAAAHELQQAQQHEASLYTSSISFNTENLSLRIESCVYYRFRNIDES
jgi:hypothetical protein